MGVRLPGFRLQPGPGAHVGTYYDKHDYEPGKEPHWIYFYRVSPGKPKPAVNGYEYNAHQAIPLVRDPMRPNLDTLDYYAALLTQEARQQIDNKHYIGPEMNSVVWRRISWIVVVLDGINKSFPTKDAVQIRHTSTASNHTFFCGGEHDLELDDGSSVSMMWVKNQMHNLNGDRLAPTETESFSFGFPALYDNPIVSWSVRMLSWPDESGTNTGGSLPPP